MMETARDQVVEEELSDQEEVRIFYCQVKTASLYRPQQVWVWVVEEGNLNKVNKTL